jgi:aspartate/methionine/tyrosine aminotransferase
VLNGFSKMLALPQVKLGWIALCGEPYLVERAGKGLETLLDFYLSVATPVQHAAAQLLSLRKGIQAELLSRLAENELYLRHQVSTTKGCRILKRQGGWYVVLEFRDCLSDEARVVELLDKRDVLVHPGYFYDFSREGFVVISLLSQTDLFREGVHRLLRHH